MHTTCNGHSHLYPLSLSFTHPFLYLFLFVNYFSFLFFCSILSLHMSVLFKYFISLLTFVPPFFSPFGLLPHQRTYRFFLPIVLCYNTPSSNPVIKNIHRRKKKFTRYCWFYTPCSRQAVSGISLSLFPHYSHSFSLFLFALTYRFFFPRQACIPTPTPIHPFFSSRV